MGRPETLQESVPGLWRVIRHFWPYIRKHRALIPIPMLALIGEVFLRLLEPWPLKFVFDRVIVTGAARRPSGLPALDALDPMTLLTVSALGVVAITGLRALASFTNTVGLARIGNRVLAEVRGDLYRHLQSLSLSFHVKARGGDLVVRVISDVSMLKDVTVTAVLPMVSNLFVLVGMIALMLWLQWELALLALAILPLFGLSTMRLSRRIREVAREQRRREGAMAATTAESIGAIKTVQALSLEPMFAATFARRNQRSLKEDMKGRRLTASLERTVDLLIAAGTAMVLWQGTRLVLRGSLSPGDLLVFLTYLKRAFNPLQDLAKYTGRMAKAAAAGERVLDILGRIPEVRDLPGATPAPAFRGEVRFEGVDFAYEPGRRVLEGIEFDATSGAHVALVGPSGIGKSTLVNLILRLYDPERGRVTIDGRDIREYTLDSVRAQVSVVLQDSLLFAASVRDNIACGSSDAAEEEVEAAARLANAHEFIAAMPDGYDTILGERGVTLSSGQRQRIAIARAAIRKSPILILDEPTTGLDEENERAVVEALERLARGRTTFLITHTLHLVARADLILYLEGGRVLECGTHAELTRAGGRYASLVRLQAAAHDHENAPGDAHALAS